MSHPPVNKQFALEHDHYYLLKIGQSSISIAEFSQQTQKSRLRFVGPPNAMFVG